ncbi:TRAP transporter large permease subunit [Uliginosibacterium sp. 31-12]|uniref:TRAP transporter large permease subunit n=1 Tax=Uliginosibacterium sp. 31-12 TaxID=3062781 RepID=UPI0026E432BE|nr:TRAP transporter large permease subunit [Uliginosibacterium sp. 31-12]MDO6388376.1 TRAP transporter large permease subunit [Uliginosibacterium sp. 31-12]
MDSVIIMGIFFLLLAVGLPVAYTLGLTAMFGAIYFAGDMSYMTTIMLKMGDGVNKFSLLAIPFFVLAGAIMAEGGIATRLINFASIFVGFIRGGLSLVNILASTFFGAISGSSVADTASIGSVMVPQMEKHGYPREYAAAVTASGSVQAILIPPSHNAVIYSLYVSGASIPALFLAGVVPGITLCLTLMALCIFFAAKRGYPKGEVLTLKQAAKQAFDAIPGLFTVVIILGGILSGLYTATESAAIACVWAFLVTMFVYRDYKWRQLPVLVHRTVKTVTIVMILIGFAAAFGQILTILSIPATISAFFTSLSDNPIIIMLAINVLLLILGTLMDMAPLIMIMTPILYPVVAPLGIHPVHFGMIMMVNLGIGLITPPVGSVLFVASAVSGRKMEQVTKAMAPFFVALFAVLMMVTYLPQLSLWLPTAVGELNAAPTVVDDAGKTAKGQPVKIEVLKNDSDKENNPLMIEETKVLEGQGTVDFDENGIVTFTPAADFAGTAVVQYQVTDFLGGSTKGKITITVAP